MEALPGFLLAGVALAGSPGPATLSLAAAAAAFGPARVTGYFIGIALGMVAVMAITASGVVGLVLALPGVTPVVTIAAAAYFVWLAWRIATAPPLADDKVQYADGTKATLDQEASDVVEFLAWASEPHMESRKKTGVRVILFLLVLAGFMYAVKRQVWADKH